MRPEFESEGLTVTEFVVVGVIFILAVIVAIALGVYTS